MYQKVYKYYVPTLVHLPIDIVYLLWYNILVNESGKVDEAQTNRRNKLVEWLRQHGKTANIKQHKGEQHYVYY